MRVRYQFFPAWHPLSRGQPPASPDNGPTLSAGHETILPHAFNTETLQDRASGAMTMIQSAVLTLMIFPYGSIKPTSAPNYTFLDDSPDIITQTIHSALDAPPTVLQPEVEIATPTPQNTPIDTPNHTTPNSPHTPTNLQPRPKEVTSLGIFLSQRKYATEILEWAGMVNCCKSCRTPVDIKSKRGDDVQQVCLYMHDPQEPHFSALKRILRYVCGTLDYGLQLFSSSTRCGLGWLPYYSEIDFSAEIEYRGNAVAETCYLRNLLRQLHTPFSFATLVYCDNVSAVYLSSIPVQHRRTKHIEIDIHFIQDLVAAGQVRVLHVPSRYQYADIFTKGLPPTLFEEFRTSLSVRCSPTPTIGE
ncbi:ribonuclease H-like domain-containing protein [Tanacetum coccineum]